MSLPTRIAAYEDCFDVFDRAVTFGARVQFKTLGEANMYGLRLNQARALRAAENKRLYPSDHVSWGKTDYDHLIVRKPREDDEGKWWVYIEPAGSDIVCVEILNEGAPE